MTEKTPIAKKPYTSPVLAVLGDVRTVTQTKSNSGATDGGSGNNKKTR